MRTAYELFEELQSRVAKLLMGNALANVYRAVLLSFVYTALKRAAPQSLAAVKSIEHLVPSHLVAIAKGDLVDLIEEFISWVSSLMKSNRPVTIDGEANLKLVLNSVKHRIGNADSVLIYDGMSPIEHVVVAAYARTQGLTSLLVEVFVNPVGVTKFVTSQSVTYPLTLSGLAGVIARELGASVHRVKREIDESIHELGQLGVEEFVKKLPIEDIAREVINEASLRRTLVLSDHGYDMVLIRGRDLYITHGFKPSSEHEHMPVLLFSRVAFYILIHKLL